MSSKKRKIVMNHKKFSDGKVLYFTQYRFILDSFVLLCFFIITATFFRIEGAAFLGFLSPISSCFPGINKYVRNPNRRWGGYPHCGMVRVYCGSTCRGNAVENAHNDDDDDSDGATDFFAVDGGICRYVHGGDNQCVITP